MGDLVSGFGLEPRQIRNLVATAVTRARERLYVHEDVAWRYHIEPNSRVHVFASLEDIRELRSLKHADAS